MTTATVPLRYVSDVRVSNVDKKSADGQERVRLVNYTDVYYRDTITPGMDLMAATATREQVTKFSLQAGDSIITKDSETASDIAVPTHVAASESDMVCAYHLAIIRPLGQCDPSFLTWALRSSHARDQFSIQANGMTRFGLTYDAIQSVSVPMPSVQSQRRIADFLDDQVARIDNIIAARSQQIGLMNDALSSELSALLTSHSHIPIRRYVREAVVGIVIQPAKLYVEAEAGVPALRGVNVREDRIVTDELVHISDVGHRAHPRSWLSQGDVVVVRTGEAGAAAVVPRWAANWNAIDLVIVRPNSSASSAFLALSLNAARRATAVSAASSGSIQQHFGVGALMGLSVPLLSLDEQEWVTTAAEEARETSRGSRRSLTESVQLLGELKRSLITAAVSGEFDVSTADGSRVSV